MPLNKETANLDLIMAMVCKLHHHRAHQVFESLGLYRGQPRIIKVLQEQEGLSHSDLAARINVQPATISKMLQRMEKAGFVMRRSDPDDQRVSRVYLTEQGRAVQAALDEAFHRFEAETFAGISEAEQAELRRLLFIVYENLERVIETWPH